MKIKLFLWAAVGTALLAVAAKDPVLMKINGKDVHLSEFEYLYNKNNQQQIEKESLEQYVDRFVTYKLKVADALAEKIDTTPAFIKEFEGYRTELVKPFLEDTTVNDRLVKEAYERMKMNVDIDHIMLPLGTDFNDNKKQIARLDSIKKCIENGEDFGALAQKFSVDPSVRRNQGHYGFISAGMFPYVWEKTAYDTPVGKVSEPFRTDFGNHLIRNNGSRPALGTVEVEHILLLFPRGASQTAKDSIKLSIDSIYTAVKAGADFEQMAREKSQDPGSAVNGGKLPWFGINQMVRPFEEVSFALKDGEISAPFETTYGYHIVKKLGHRDVPALADVRANILKKISMDERSTMARDAKIEELKKLYKYKVNEKASKVLEAELKKHGQYDSAFVQGVLAKSKVPLFSFAKKVVPISVLAKLVNPKAQLNNESAVGYIMGKVDGYAKKEIMDYYIDNIINDNAEYRNLIHEYKDGMLLFEVSNQKVWEGASKDTVGLTNYFEANRAKYTWDKPRFKGIILSAKNDSIADAVKRDMAILGQDTLTQALHNKYGNRIKMERMLFAEGENKLVDRVVFKQDIEVDKKAKYPVSFVLEGGVIAQPQEYSDVRGLVTSDYQDVREKAWIQALKQKYPVEIYKNVLKKVK